MRICPRCRSVYAAPVAHCGLDGEKIIEQDKDPLIGEVLERYRIVARVGQGAMGIVYRARHTVISRDYAIKVLFGELAANRTILARMRREAQAASKIRHPNVVNVEDFGSTTAGLHFLVMELVSGRTLYEVIKREAPLAPARAAGIARQLASGLAEAHRLGFVHRDLKPSNVMLSEVDGREHAKLLDFGVVAVQREEAAGAAPLTALGAIIGTPMYMAPEQSESECSPAVDLYALGVILFEMLEGVPPFSGRPREVMKKHLSEAPPKIADAGGLEMLVAALLEKDPQHRPAGAEAVVAAIDALDFSEVVRGGPRVAIGELAEDVVPEVAPDVAARAALATSPSLAIAERDAFAISIAEEPTTRDVRALPKPPQPAPTPGPAHSPERAHSPGPAHSLASTHLPGPAHSPERAHSLAIASPNAIAASPLASPNAIAAPHFASPNAIAHAPLPHGPSPIAIAHAPPARPRSIAAASPGAIHAAPLDTFTPAFETRAQRTPRTWFIALGALTFALAGALAASYLRATQKPLELTELPDLPNLRADRPDRPDRPEHPEARPLPRVHTATIATNSTVDRPAPPPAPSRRPTPPADLRLSVLEVHLQQALSERGLTIADLDDLPAVAPLAKRWRTARESNATEEALDATRALSDELDRTQLGAPFLKLKLKRLTDRLPAAATPTGATPEIAELRTRAAQIGAEVRAGLAPAAYTNLAIMIMILEDDLNRVQSPSNSR